MAKETDLLKDPVSVAQLRYREQISAFKAQYLPDPKKEGKTKVGEWRHGRCNQID